MVGGINNRSQENCNSPQIHNEFKPEESNWSFAGVAKGILGVAERLVQATALGALKSAAPVLNVPIAGAKVAACLTSPDKLKWIVAGAATSVVGVTASLVGAIALGVLIGSVFTLGAPGVLLTIAACLGTATIGSVLAMGAGVYVGSKGEPTAVDRWIERLEGRNNSNS